MFLKIFLSTFQKISQKNLSEGRFREKFQKRSGKFLDRKFANIPEEAPKNISEEVPKNIPEEVV